MSTTPVISDKYIAPLQPDLSRQLRYNERLLTWNPYSKKNLALCYQFQTGEDGAPVRLIPDACIDFLFRCTPGSPAAVVSGLQTAPRELVLEPNAVYFGFKPVSYTHLDVYKRQVEGCLNCRKGLKRLKSTVPGPKRAVFYNEDGRIRNKLCLKIQELHIAPPYNLYRPDSSRFRARHGLRRHI